jgi:hypothetical protein
MRTSFVFSIFSLSLSLECVSALTDIRIHEIEPINGEYLRLLNNSRTIDYDLTGHALQQNIAFVPVARYRFPLNTILRAGQTVTVGTSRSIPTKNAIDMDSIGLGLVRCIETRRSSTAAHSSLERTKTMGNRTRMCHNSRESHRTGQTEHVVRVFVIEIVVSRRLRGHEAIIVSTLIHHYHRRRRRHRVKSIDVELSHVSCTTCSRSSREHFLYSNQK